MSYPLTLGDNKAILLCLCTMSYYWHWWIRSFTVALIKTLILRRLFATENLGTKPWGCHQSDIWLVWIFATSSVSFRFLVYTHSCLVRFSIDMRQSKITALVFLCSYARNVENMPISFNKFCQYKVINSLISSLAFIRNILKHMFETVVYFSPYEELHFFVWSCHIVLIVSKVRPSRGGVKGRAQGSSALKF